MNPTPKTHLTPYQLALALAAYKADAQGCVNFAQALRDEIRADIEIERRASP